MARSMLGQARREATRPIVWILPPIPLGASASRAGRDKPPVVWSLGCACGLPRHLTGSSNCPVHRCARWPSPTKDSSSAYAGDDADCAAPAALVGCKYSANAATLGFVGGPSDDGMLRMNAFKSGRTVLERLRVDDVGRSRGDMKRQVAGSAVYWHPTPKHNRAARVCPRYGHTTRHACRRRKFVR
jgi:hypothetical protein